MYLTSMKFEGPLDYKFFLRETPTPRDISQKIIPSYTNVYKLPVVKLCLCLNSIGIYYLWTLRITCDSNRIHKWFRSFSSQALEVHASCPVDHAEPLFANLFPSDRAIDFHLTQLRSRDVVICRYNMRETTSNNYAE